MSKKWQYERLETDEPDGRQGVFVVGQGEVASIEREAETLTYEVHYTDGTVKTYPAAVIAAAIYTPEEYERIGTRNPATVEIDEMKSGTVNVQANIGTVEAGASYTSVRIGKLG